MLYRILGTLMVLGIIAILILGFTMGIWIFGESGMELGMVLLIIIILFASWIITGKPFEICSRYINLMANLLGGNLT